MASNYYNHYYNNDNDNDNDNDVIIVIIIIIIVIIIVISGHGFELLRRMGYGAAKRM